MVTEWNDTARAFPATCVHDLIELQAGRAPEATAILWEGGRLTYRELEERARGLAVRLLELGIRTETPVGVATGRSPEMAICLLAVLKAGGVYLPLDPSYPFERLSFMLRDSGAPLVLVPERYASLFEHSESRVLILEREDLAARDALALRPETGPDHLAYLLYTSGSTGRPKGVAVAHAALANLVHGHVEAYGVIPADRATLLASPGFDASVWEILPYLAAGACVAIASDEIRLSPTQLAEWMVSERISISHVPTPIAKELFELRWPAETPLRALLTGGDRLGSRPAEELPFRVINNYGPTEATVLVSRGLVAPGNREPGAPLIGRPVGNARIHLLDHRLEHVPIGASGELCIGGTPLARGYLGRPELTAERFVPDFLGDERGARLYRTGDLVRFRPDGRLEFLGRIDHQVKIRGVRIELGEIELLLSRHPKVRDAAVLARKDGRGDLTLVAYVAAAAGAPPPRELKRLLRDHLLADLPDSMAPAEYVFLDALPLTAHGKIDRGALPAPEGAAETGLADGGDHRSPVEELLAGIWADVLARGRVDVHDDFFELGGHSLLATQVVSRIRHLFQVELPLRSLFEEPTVAGLARRVESAMREDRASGAPALEPVPRTGELPLSFAQERLWFLDQLEPGTPLYNIPLALRVRGALDPRLLEAALSEIARRHEALRTTFKTVGERRVQVVEPPAPLRLPVVDLQGLPAGGREREGRRLAAEEARRPFDLARGPLLRVTLLTLGPAGAQGPQGPEHLVLITMHHIVSDAWSMGLLVRELTELDRGLLDGSRAGAARAAGPVRGLRLLAARVALRGDPRGGAGLLAAATGRGTVRARSAHRPAAPPRAQPAWRLAPAGAAAGVVAVSRGRQPAPGRHSLHDPAGGVPGPSRALRGAGRRARRHARGGPYPDGGGGAPGLLRQHPGDPHGPGGRSFLRRPAGTCAGQRTGGLRAPGSPVREADRGAATGAEPQPQPPLPGGARAAERSGAPFGAARPLPDPRPGRRGDREVRPDPVAGAGGRPAGGRPGARGRPLRRRDGGPSAPALRHTARSRSVASGGQAERSATPFARGAASDRRRMERQAFRLSGERPPEPALRGQGRRGARGPCAQLLRSANDLPGAERRRQPAGLVSARARREARDPGRPLPGALAGDGGGLPGHSEGRRLLRPSRPRVPRRTAALDARGLGGPRAAYPGWSGRGPGGLRRLDRRSRQGARADRPAAGGKSAGLGRR